jgi:hypothetical protein
MNKPFEHPFTTGVQVAVYGVAGTVRSETVNKIYKNGNFTLLGSPQQWRPYSIAIGNSVVWRANKTSRDSWDRTYLTLWDEAANAAKIKQSLSNRWWLLQKQLERVREPDITKEFLDQIEKALDASKIAEPVI